MKEDFFISSFDTWPSSFINWLSTSTFTFSLLFLSFCGHFLNIHTILYPMSNNSTFMFWCFHMYLINLVRFLKRFPCRLDEVKKSHTNFLWSLKTWNLQVFLQRNIIQRIKRDESYLNRGSFSLRCDDISRDQYLISVPNSLIFSSFRLIIIGFH